MAGPSTWKIDGSHSNVEFAVRHLMVSTVRGRFGAVEGTLVLDRDHAANSHVDVTIAVASIDTRNEQRDGHLRSADFFDAENHPHITFRSTSVVPAGGETYKVHGDLSIRGVTHPVTLDAQVEPGGEQLVGDPDRLEQALQNLAANAMRHTPDGGTVRLQSTRLPGGLVRLRVRDTGSGIPDAHLPLIFDRFYKVDVARKATGGSGLGLSIVKAIVEGHGGSITAYNDPGAVFEIVLPA